jgi:hypothetical protein
LASEDQFGYSLLLDEGDIVLKNGTLKLIEGKSNLLQALSLRVLTPFGSDIFNISYGLDLTEAFTQPLGLNMVKEFLKLNLVRTLGTDPRVQEIRDVLFEDDPQYLAQHPELSLEAIQDLRHKRFWQVDVVLDLIDGQTQTLAVNVGV